MSAKFFYLLLLFLPLQLGRHFWPQASFVSGIRVDYLSPTIYITDIFIFLILFAWAWESKKKILLPFLFIFTLSPLYYSNLFYYAFIKIIEYTLLGIYIVHTKVKLTSFITPLTIALIYSSVLAIGQFLFQKSLGGPFWLLGERTFIASTPGIAQIDITGQLILRSYATFPHPNVLGGFLTFGLTVIAFHLLRKKSKLLLFAFIIGFIALILTFSLSAYLAFVIGLSLILLRIKGRKNQSKRFNLFFLLIIFLSILLYFKINAAGFNEDNSFRWQLNEAAVKMWQKNPLFGVGLNNFIPSLSQYLNTSNKVFWWQPVHNIYLLTLAQNGLLGLSLLLGGLFFTFKKALLLWQKRIILPLILISQLLFIGLIDHYFLTLQQGQILTTLTLALAFLPKNSYT